MEFSAGKHNLSPQPPAPSPAAPDAAAPGAAWDALLCELSADLPAMIWTCGLDGRCSSVNQRWLDFTGLTREQSLGLRWAEAIHPDDLDRVLAVRQVGVDGRQPFQAEYRVKRADGQYRWMLVQGAPQFTPAGEFRGYAGHMVDITDRKRAEHQLRWMFQAVEQSPASVIITDLKGKIEYVNPKFTALTGYAIEEVLGRNPRLLKSGETPTEQYAELWRTIQTGEWRGEFHNKKKNGELYWELASICPIRDHLGKPTHYIAVKEDITERKRIEAALRESEERFRMAAGNASDHIYEWDLASGKVRVWASEGAARIRSYGDWERRLHPEDHDRVVESIRQGLESGRPFRAEYRIMAADGALRHHANRAEAVYDEHGKPCRVIGAVSDITGRKQAEDVLARLATIVQYSNDAILAMDRAGRIVSWNPAAETLYGYPSEEILGRYAIELVNPDRLVEAGRIMAAALRGEGVTNYEAVSVRRDGSLVAVSITLSPVRDSAGKVVRVSAIIRDISEQRRAQEALQESENRFRALIQKSSDAITLLDAGGRMVYDNGGLDRILGAAPEERAGHLFEWVHPEDLPEARLLLEQVLGDPERQPRRQLRLRHQDGSWRWCDVASTNLLSEPGVHALVINSRDVTEQARTEDALRESEQKYRRLVENAVDVIFTINLEGDITSINSAGEALTGYSRQQLLGMTLAQLAAPEYWQLIQEAIAARLGGAPSVSREVEIVACDGGRIPLEIRGSLLFENGLAAGLEIIARDIRQRRRNERLERDRRAVLEMIAGNQPLHDVLSHLVEMVEHYHPLMSARVALSGAFRSADSEAARNAAWARGWTGGLAIPIRAGSGVLLGSIEIHCEPRPLTGAEVDFLEAQAKLAALALQHRQLSDRLAFQALHDPLTGLPNRALLEDRLQHAIAMARRENKMVAIIYLDLDRFKLVNDTLGHAAGDMLLEEAAQRLAGAARESDTLARMGGDEFVAVCYGFENPADAEAVGAKFVAAMRKPLHVNGHELYLSLSAGLSLFPRDGEDAALLLKNADIAMYNAKKNGKNRFQRYAPAMNPAAAELLEFEGCLHRAIERQEFALHYQPQFDLASGKLAGMEALLRWNHPERGLILPGRFIPLAEECGLIMPIGAWVLDEACRQHRLWRDAGYPPVKIAINVSALQFACSNPAERVAAAMERYGIEPRYLELEITEGVLMRDVPDSARQLAALRELGTSVSIDDFGMGYSSLSYLQKLPIDNLKIDQCFVMGIGQPESTQPLVQAVIGLAHGLKLTATAEGVETVAQLKALQSLGCDMAQGYLLGRPVPAAECESFLAQTRPLPFPLPPPDCWPETAPRA